MQELPLYVVLVDENDHEQGFMEKMEAHRQGALHRAISVFIFNDKGEWLLQQRASDKYHCPGKWSNTCCTHPLPGESYETAAQRRLKEEMGLCVPLKQEWQFIYRAELDDGLVEHEYDTVFTGISNADPIINPQEVAAYRYISAADLESEILTMPENFTPWFLKMYSHIKTRL